MITKVENVKSTTRASIASHNFFMREDFSSYCPNGYQNLNPLTMFFIPIQSKVKIIA